jgi:hypothetical protein
VHTDQRHHPGNAFPPIQTKVVLMILDWELAIMHPTDVWVVTKNIDLALKLDITQCLGFDAFGKLRFHAFCCFLA